MVNYSGQSQVHLDKRLSTLLFPVLKDNGIFLLGRGYAGDLHNSLEPVSQRRPKRFQRDIPLP